MLLKNYMMHQKELEKLWIEAFGDEQAFVNLIFDTPGTDVLVFSDMIGRKVVSALYLLPAKIVDDGVSLGGYYVYACATGNEFRNQGRMSRLILEAAEEAKIRGAGFLALVPGEESLYSYYERFGFKTAMYKCERNFSFTAFPNRENTEQILSCEEYFRLRGKALKRYFSLSGGGLRYLEAVLSFEGYYLLRCLNCVFTLMPSSDGLIELLSLDGGEVSKEKMNLLFSNPEEKELHYVSPYGREKKPFGMVMPLSTAVSAIELEDIYMNFALD